MSTDGFQNSEVFIAVALVVGALLLWLARGLMRSRPDLRVIGPIAVGFGLRLAAIIGIGLTGLGSTLRGGDETTFLGYAHFLAHQPLSLAYVPHSVFELHVVLFALEDRIGLTVGAMRIVQVGIALAGVVLILAAVYDLAGGRAARLAAWLMALEPASIFFNSALHKEPNMELAAGMVVFGGTMIWRRLDVRGLVLFALAGLIAVWTRSYAGWFLVSASVFILLHAALRSLNRPLRAMPIIYGVLIGAFLVTPTLLAATSGKNLRVLQQSQNAYANAIGTGSGGPNTDNLKDEKVDFSSRGKVLQNLPLRIRDLILKPYPWQLSDTSQRFGAIGTLLAYVLFAFLIIYAWESRGKIFARAGPVLYPMLFLLVAYSLAAGNAGTGFRYRTHLVTLAIAAVAILREQALLARARRRERALGAPAPGVVPSPLAAPVRLTQASGGDEPLSAGGP
jgi:hypothetical protein